MISLRVLVSHVLPTLKLLVLLAVLLVSERIYSSHQPGTSELTPNQSPVRYVLFTFGLPLGVLLCNIPRPDHIKLGPVSIRIRLKNFPRVLELVWKTPANDASHNNTSMLAELTHSDRNVQPPGGNEDLNGVPISHPSKPTLPHSKLPVAPTIVDKEIKNEPGPVEPPAPIYLCLQCRQSGHHIDQCPFPLGADNEDWSQAISVAQTIPDTDISASDLCFRCEKLNIMEMFEHPADFRFRLHTKRGDHARPSYYEYKDHWGNITAKTDKHSFHESDKDYFVQLGYSDSTYFRTDCAMCLLLFTISPCCNDLRTRLLIIPDWIEHRQEPSMKVPSARASRAICIYVSVAESDEYVQFFVLQQRPRDSS